jgi:dienelactone hydrolase
MTVGDLNTLIPLRQNIDVLLALSGLTLEGDLSVPENSRGIVLFASVSGSSRHSPHNHYIAGVLNKHGLSTLIIDLLTPQEEKEKKEGSEGFNTSMLAERLSEIVVWVRGHSKIGGKPIGIFGYSAGGATAMLVACMRPNQIKAVVSCAGRVDLVENCLSRIATPALLIVGDQDKELLKINQLALIKLNRNSDMVIIPNTANLFAPQPVLEEVSDLSAQWFEKHLGARG